MLNETQYRQYTTQLQKLSDPAKEFFDYSRQAEASRMVGTQAKSNVCCWAVSQKMGFTLSMESRLAEKAFFLMCDNDPNVLELWDQPSPIRVIRTTKKGTRRAGYYTADFLVCTKNGIKVVEVKTKDGLVKEAEKTPEDWFIDADGKKAMYLPAKRAFSEIGIDYSVFIYDESLRYKVSNLEMLMRSRSSEDFTAEEELTILNLFNDRFAWSLRELKTESNLKSFHPIIRLIDNGKLFFDINNHALFEPDNCLLVRSKPLLDPAIELYSSNQLYRDGMTDSAPFYKFPSTQFAGEVLERLDKLNAGDASRSARRWRSLIAEGENSGLTPFQSLISKKYLSGNRKTKVPGAVADYLTNYLRTTHADSQGISKYRSYIRYKESVLRELPHHVPVSMNTFLSKLSEIPDHVIAERRGGKRAGNAKAAPSDPNKRSLKAQVAWQSAAIDHYLADIYLVFFSGKGYVQVMRPWITAMIDLYKSKVLAITISFKSPSRVSCAKVFRECIRKHGRSPNEIIVDRGSDFTSVFFTSLLAHYKVDYSLRPSGHSRYGGEIEGFFGEFKKQWLSQRSGNLADFNEVRAVDGKFHPQKTAVLRPYDFYREIQEFCNWRDNKCRGNSSTSAAYQHEKSEADYPFMGIRIDYDSEFLLATAVESKKYKIDFQRGLHINDMWFWNPAISALKGKRTHLEVRIDPENPHVVYALVNNEWIHCGSSRLNSFSSKNHISQFVEGLELLETATERSRIQEEADIELASIVRKMDELAGQDRGVPILEIEHDCHSGFGSIFKNINDSNIGILEVDNWGDE